MNMEEEIKHLKRMRTAVRTVGKKLRSVHPEIFDELLEDSLSEAENELNIRIEDLESEHRESMRGFEE